MINFKKIFWIFWVYLFVCGQMSRATDSPMGGMGPQIFDHPSGAQSTEISGYPSPMQNVQNTPAPSEGPSPLGSIQHQPSSLHHSPSSSEIMGSRTPVHPPYTGGPALPTLPPETSGPSEPLGAMNLSAPPASSPMPLELPAQTSEAPTFQQGFSASEHFDAQGHLVSPVPHGHPENPQILQTIQNHQGFSPNIQEILDRGELVVAMHAVDQPPFFMEDQDGNLIGLDVEIAKKMAEALGVKVRFNREAQTFNDVIDIVASGKANVGISKLSYTLDRAKKVLYSDPYIKLNKMLLINRIQLAKARGKRGAETLEKLFNHKEGTIGVEGQGSYERFAELLFPNATIVPLKSWGKDSLTLATHGKILAIFRDDLEILKLIRQAPDSNLYALPVLLKDQIDPLHIVLSWDKDHFLKWINGFLTSLKLNMTVEELLNSYDDYFKWKTSQEPVSDSQEETTR